MKYRITVAEKAIACLMAAIVVLFTISSQLMLSGFEQLFAEADWSLPLSTNLVLDTYRWWVLLALGAFVGACLVTISGNRHGWLPIALTAIVAVILFPVMIRAMYAPVMQ